MQFAEETEIGQKIVTNPNFKTKGLNKNAFITTDI